MSLFFAGLGSSFVDPVLLTCHSEQNEEFDDSPLRISASEQLPKVQLVLAAKNLTYESALINLRKNEEKT